MAHSVEQLIFALCVIVGISYGWSTSVKFKYKSFTMPPSDHNRNELTNKMIENVEAHIIATETTTQKVQFLESTNKSVKVSEISTENVSNNDLNSEDYYSDDYYENYRSGPFLLFAITYH